MSSATSIENVITNNKNIANHPQLAPMVSEYIAILSNGYDPDTDLLSDIYSVLSTITVDDPDTSEDTEYLQIILIEEVITRDTALDLNRELEDMLETYLEALSQGYNPPEETIDSIIASLSLIDTIDPQITSLITSVVSSLTPKTFGTILQGVSPSDFSGFSVSSAGDINGDGIDDILIGAPSASADGKYASGVTYVIFGNLSGLEDTVDLATLDGTNGFVISGLNANDQSGRSVSSAGDVNGDGIDDILIGAPFSDTGETYVIFGGPSAFAPSISLDSLDGTNGFTVSGIYPGDASGVSVSSAGDFNADGIDDILIGAIGVDKNGLFSIGATYVVFGSASGFNANFNLDDIDGTNGIALYGIDQGDNSGISVSSAGDINGDGIDDILIGARLAAPNGISAAGETYVVFGSNTHLPAELDLETLDGTNGFTLNGIDQLDASGKSVSSAGDVNGDGIDDIIVSAYNADPDGKSGAGETYVVFGSNSGFSPKIDLSSINGTNGFVIFGIHPGDNSGYAVSQAGDVNGDGLEDILVSAYSADPDGKYNAGETYLVFGTDSGFSASLDLETLDGDNGFSFRGVNGADYSGTSVSSAGDVNGDGFDDILIGATQADPRNVSNAGETYVIYGGESSLLRFDYADGNLDGSISLELIGLNPADFDFILP